jgi:hypothetical protein
VLSYDPRMEVFLIPVGGDRYELYCEVPDEEPDAEAEPPTGFVRKLVHTFRQALAEAERERRRAPHVDDRSTSRTWYQRVKRYTLRKIAEGIAEQRLLWHMRRQHQAVVVHPDDLPGSRALEIVRAAMQADYDKHRRWLAIDGTLFVLSGLLMLVPGPNVLAYYLAFRLVGHYLSMRGATQALRVVAWETRASEPLAELRQAIALEPEAREARVTEIAARLRLERLVTFFQRTAVPSA